MHRKGSTMNDFCLGFNPPSVSSKRALTRIVRVNDRNIRVYVGLEWLNLLHEEHRERLAIGLCDELPGHLLIVTAKESYRRGNKCNIYGYKNANFATRANPVVIRHLFPNPNERYFVPKKIFLHTRTDGVTAIALEWPDSVECLRALNNAVQEDEIQSRDMGPTSGVSQHMDPLERPSEPDEVSVEMSDIRAEDDQSAVSNTGAAIESNCENTTDYVQVGILEVEHESNVHDGVVTIDGSPNTSLETVD